MGLFHAQHTVTGSSKVYGYHGLRPQWLLLCMQAAACSQIWTWHQHSPAQLGCSLSKHLRSESTLTNTSIHA